MRARCNNPKNEKYPSYGAKGIKVCDRWSVFANFLADMGNRPRGHTIDRIDGSKGYEPGNCRWATPKQQQRNIKTNVMIEIKGEKKTASEWSEISGISTRTILQRWRAGWTGDQMLNVRPFTGNRINKMPCALLTALGETLSFSDWGVRFGLKPNTIRERIRRGIHPDDAVRLPTTRAGGRVLPGLVNRADADAWVCGGAQ